MPRPFRPKLPRVAAVAAVAAAAVAFVAPAAEAQGRLQGVVRNSAGESVRDALVTAPALGRSARSAGDGTYELTNLPTGELVVTVAAAGYPVLRASIAISATGATRFDPVLAEPALELAGVLVEARPTPGTLRPAPDRVESFVTIGARSEVVFLRDADANVAEKVPRQVFARVPGILVYDMDGAGNQTNVSTRGLDPHRSWEFNVRQDGFLVNSDIYGYPASHYSPPLEAMEQLELVRGTAALQYGAQFGGLLNYRTRAPDTTVAAAYETSVTAGSFGMVNLFGMAGGRVGAFDYQVYAARRESDGYRASSESDYDAQYAALTWRASPTLRLRTQLGRSWYRHRVPGPLTDAMLAADPRQATRTRNWFSPEIYTPGIRLEWEPAARTRVSAQYSGVFGERGSVLFVGFATTPDLRDQVSGEFAPRVVDIDNFNSRTAELRVTHEHRVAGRDATLAAGVTVADNLLHRRQQGAGSRGTDFDLTVSGAFGRDLRYRSRGVSWYAEEVVAVTDRWRVIPGVRLEGGRTRMSGTLAYYDPADVPRSVRHDRPLLGVRTSYRRSDDVEFYGGWSEAFRPMLLKDLLPENAIERSDPAMRDASGWTAEAGVRGRHGPATFDVGAFLMRYDDRFGGVLRDDGDGPYLFKTNVGSASTLGLEATGELLLRQGARTATRAFLAAAVFDARYLAGTAVLDGSNRPLRGNAVEGVPRAIVRGGLVIDGSSASATLMASHTSASFADPLNVRTPTANGARGLVPAYTVLDAWASYRIARKARVRLAVSNLLDARYFTKRPAFYPGPGVWPSDGRAVQLGFSVER